jgi:hypothetical protein
VTLRIENCGIEGLTPELFGYRDLGTMDLGDGLLSAYLQSLPFDETFGVNSAFNAKVPVASPHAVAMKSM